MPRSPHAHHGSLTAITGSGVPSGSSRRRKSRRRRRTPAAPRFEALEVRNLLSTFSVVGVGSMATFTDAQSNVITIQAVGTKGTATFLDAGAGDVDDGEDIASVSITGASSDFLLSISVDGSSSTGNAVLGNIDAMSLILGIFTNTDATTPVLFDLLSFTGPGFSPHGGLAVDRILGDANNMGLNLDALPADRTVTVRDSLDADVVIGGPVGGNLLFGGSTVSSNVTLNKGLLPTGALNSASAFGSNVTINGTVAGSATISGPATGTWAINGAVKPSAHFFAESFPNVEVNGSFNGNLLGVGGPVSIHVQGGLGNAAILQSGGDLTVTIGGGVPGGAHIAAGGSLIAGVGGPVAGDLDAGNNLELTAGKGLSGANINAGANATVTVTGAVTRHTCINADNLTVSVSGHVKDSTMTATNLLSLDVGGNLTNSVLEGSSSDMTATIGGNVVRSRVTCGSEDVSMVVGGNVVRSTFVSTESAVSLTVAGNLIRSQIEADELSVSVNGKVVKSRIIGDEESRGTVTVGQHLLDSRVATLSDDLTVNVGGNVLRSTLHSGDNLTVGVNGQVKGTTMVAGNNLTATIGGNVSDSILNATNVLSASVGGNVSRSVFEGSNSDLTLEVAGHMSDSSVSCGSEDVSVMVGGNVSNSTFMSSESTVSLDVGGNLSSSVLEGSGVSLNVSGNIVNTRIVGDETTTTITVGRDVKGSRIVALDTTLTLDIQGRLTDSKLTADSGLTTTVGGDVSGTMFRTTNGPLSLDVGGGLNRSRVKSGGSATLGVDGPLTRTPIVADTALDVQTPASISGGRLIAGTHALVGVGGQLSSPVTAGGTLTTTIGTLNAPLTANQLSLFVTGNVGPGSRIQANTVTGMGVGGAFAGDLHARDLMVGGTLIDGPVSRGSQIIVSGTFGNGAVRFGATDTDDFMGRLILRNDLAQDLTFGGDAHRVVIGGLVRSDIVVFGRLTFLASGSRFEVVTATEGNFLDGRNAVTGTLLANDGYTQVVP